jgi:alpha-1,3-rhamnosyltransferase
VTVGATAAVSVLLLCWNHAPYLEACIESIARQQPGAEIVFLDNGSSDGSFGLARELFDRSGLQATMLRNDAPQSIPANFNTLLSASSGELVAILSTDDWYDAGYVEALTDAARADPEAGWFSCSGWLDFDDSGASVPVDETQFVTDRPVADVILDGREPHFFVGCAYRRSALEAVGGWDEGQLIEDRDLFLRLSTQFRHHRIPRRLVHYRRTSSSASANAAFMLKGWELFFAKHAALFGPRLAARRAETYRAYAALLVDQGRFADALAAILQSLRLRPFDPLTWRTAAYLARRRIKEALSGKTRPNP